MSDSAAEAAAAAALTSRTTALVVLVPHPLRLDLATEGAFDDVIPSAGGSRDPLVCAQLRRWVDYGRRVMVSSGVRFRSGFVSKRRADGDR